MSKVAEYFFPEDCGITEENEPNGLYEDEELRAYEEEYEHERKLLASAREASVFIEHYQDPEFLRATQIDNYWVAFLSYLDAVGKYSWVVKLEYNSNERGIFPTQVIKHDYYRGRQEGSGAVEANFQQSKQDRRDAVWAAAYGLNHWSKKVGYRELSDDEIRGLTNYLIGRVKTDQGHDPGKRRKNYFRANAKRFRERGELRSVEEILERCVALEN